MRARVRRASFRASLAVSLVWLCLAVPASAAVIAFEDNYGVSRNMSISNGFTLNPVIFPVTEIMQLNRFDPSLGTLTSVELFISGAIFGDLDVHCVGPITCNSSGGGVVSTGLVLFETAASLGVDLGPTFMLSMSGERSCSFTTLGSADCSRTWVGQESASRLLTFTGTDMTGFTGTTPFYFFSYGQPHLTTSIRHEGFPNSSPGGPGDVDAAQSAASLPGLNDLLDLAYQLYLNDVFDNHSVAFSDAHLYGDEAWLVRVSYTYEPAVEAVPEPGIAALVGMALAAVGVRGRLGLGGGNAGSRQRTRANRR